MKIFQMVESGIMTGVLCAMVVLLTACDPAAPPRAAEEEKPIPGYQIGSGSDKTMDHNGEVSGNSDPARRD